MDDIFRDLPAFEPGSVWLAGAGPGEPGLLSRYLNRGQTLTVGALMQRTVTLPDSLEPQKR